MSQLRSFLLKNQSKNITDPYNDFLNRYNSLSRETTVIIENNYTLNQKNISYIPKDIFTGIFKTIFLTIAAPFVADLMYSGSRHGLHPSSTTLLAIATIAFIVSVYDSFLNIKASAKDAFIKELIEYGEQLDKPDIRIINTFKQQLDLLLKYKKDGLDIERQAFELQEKLFTLENQQNKQMIDDMLRTLEDIRR